uniref:Doublecortin-like kinase 3 n=1 Tax=Denticeps clupeoides TaxID=299321 RepID=A0AAY4CM64_9TELE
MKRRSTEREEGLHIKTHPHLLHKPHPLWGKASLKTQEKTLPGKSSSRQNETTPATQEINPAPHVESQDPHRQSGCKQEVGDWEECSEEDIKHCYDIGGVIGDGNFAEVRVCVVRQTGRTCAMKVVDKAKLQGRDHMIHNEVALLASLRHPRLVRLLRSHHTHAHVYMLMELVTGGDLFDAIARNVKFSEVCAAGMVRDISEGLKFIHNRRIAHRDIKPENLLTSNLLCITLKLADFGLALLVTEPLFTICGTPTYVAPEILAETGECYGVAVDVWAMGVILYVLLCGFPPFRSAERNQTELFRLIRAGELHFFSPYWDMVSTGAKDLIRALLQVNPKGRLTATQTLQHDWLRSFCRTSKQKYQPHETSPDQHHKPAVTSLVKQPASPTNSHYTTEPGPDQHKNAQSCTDRPRSSQSDTDHLKPKSILHRMLKTP